MKSLLRQLVQCIRVDEKEGDDIIRQFTENSSAMIDKECEIDRFKKFDPVKSRVDTLMFETRQWLVRSHKTSYGE